MTSAVPCVYVFPHSQLSLVVSLFLLLCTDRSSPARSAAPLLAPPWLQQAQLTVGDSHIAPMLSAVLFVHSLGLLLQTFLRLIGPEYVRSLSMLGESGGRGGPGTGHLA